MLCALVLLLVCGVDDAGRGSMLGPLVIAGICMQKDHIVELQNLGIRDSKMHTARARCTLFPQICRIADSYHIVYVHPRSIDASVKQHGLNRLEAKYMARVIQKLNPDVAYVDSCDVDTQRFARYISNISGNDHIESYHHADSKFTIVSAASILAKVARDASIKRIAKKNSNVGSGYPSDSKSVLFLESYYRKTDTVPTFARKSWKPVKKILEL